MKIQLQMQKASHQGRRIQWLKNPINSGVYRNWLIDKGSLTLRLQLRTKKFKVKPLKVENAKPQIDEALLLGVTQHQLALLREVQLIDGAMPVVFAHSILPHRSLSGAWLGLRRLGNKPLGATLFSNPKVKRTPLKFKKLARHHTLYRRATAHLEVKPITLWARRSVFILGNAQILVTEVFLPGILAL
jgi:chorismate--pyruvate lyase